MAVRLVNDIPARAGQSGSSEGGQIPAAGQIEKGGAVRPVNPCHALVMMALGRIRSVCFMQAQRLRAFCQMGELLVNIRHEPHAIRTVARLSPGRRHPERRNQAANQNVHYSKAARGSALRGSGEGCFQTMAQWDHTSQCGISLRTGSVFSPEFFRHRPRREISGSLGKFIFQSDI